MDREFAHVSHPVSPIVKILHYHGTFITTKKPTLVHFYQLSSTLHSDFNSFSTNVLFLFQEPVHNARLSLVIMSP